MSCGRAAGAVSDLTYISVGPTYAYLYIIMDAFSRKIVGWSFEKTMHAQGALGSMNMALLARKDISQSLIHHRSGDPVRSGRPILLLGVCATITSSECHHKYD
jgi:transposase InsO family protein